MAEPDVCESCSKPIHPGERVFFHHGAVLHSRCWGRLTRLQARELAERAEGQSGPRRGDRSALEAPHR
jgi:hypothetical protein